MIRKMPLLLILTMFSIMLLTGCATRKKSTNKEGMPVFNPDSNKNWAEQQVDWLKAQDTLENALNNTSLGWSCNEYNLAYRYYYGTQDTPKNCSEAIKWATKSTSFDIKQDPAENALGSGCGDRAAELLITIYGSEGQCKNLNKAEQSKLLLSTINDDKKEWAKRWEVNRLNLLKDAEWRRKREADEANQTKQLRREAEQGNAQAQFQLGTKYSLGEEVAKDDAEALKWLRRSADQGFPRAQLMIGIGYASGRYGLTKNSVEAKKWLQKASANRTDAWAQGSAETFLAELYGINSAKNSVASLNNLTREKPIAQNNDPYPQRPDKQPGAVACRTNCINADCYRTYGDGRKVRFQAKRIFDPLNNQWKYDSGGC